MKEKNKVELIPAAMWVCDNCGIDNFERMILDESMTEEEEAEILEELDDPDAISAESYSYPIDVKCKSCGEEFEIETPKCDECREREENEQDEDE